MLSSYVKYSFPFIRIAFIGPSVVMQVYRLRLLGDYHHSTRIAFVEFIMVFSLHLYSCMPYFSFLI